VLHASLPSPEHFAPPKAGAGLSHERVLVPPLQDALQALHALHTPFTGHAWVLHASLPAPEHGAPPKAGAGLLHERVLVPPLQDALQALHALHPPSFGRAVSVVARFTGLAMLKVQFGKGKASLAQGPLLHLVNRCVRLLLAFA